MEPNQEQGAENAATYLTAVRLAMIGLLASGATEQVLDSMLDVAKTKASALSETQRLALTSAALDGRLAERVFTEGFIGDARAELKHQWNYLTGLTDPFDEA